jgi:membrane protease YdiL (CAAX protease family)
MSANAGAIARRGYALAMIAGVPLVVGLMLAPYVFNLLIWIGRTRVGCEALRGVEFESVTTRCVLTFMLFLIWPALRVAGGGKTRIKNLFSGTRRFKRMALGVGTGVASMLILPLLGYVQGVFLPVFDIGSGFLLEGLLVLILGLGIAFLEELIFRGILFDLISRMTGLAVGVALAAAFFSFSHFLNPIKPSGVVYGHWYSGLQLFGMAIRSFNLTNIHIFPYCATLFFIGASLCLVFNIERNLYLIAGIHAGWIWVLKMLGSVLQWNPEHSSRLFVPGVGLEKSYGALIVALLFFMNAVYWWLKRRDEKKDGIDCGYI